MRDVFPGGRIASGALAALLLLGAGSAGCHKAGSVAGQTCSAPGLKKFGEACRGPCECESGLCWEFGDGERACTKRCDGAAGCPSGSRGQKCTAQGVCRT